MLIANPKLITKIIVSAAVVLGSCVVGLAPARADTDPSDTQPNPFSAIGCGCQEPGLAGVPTAELDRGIRDGAH